MNRMHGFMKYLITHIYPSAETLQRVRLQQLLHTLLEEHRWVEPVRYGDADMQERFVPGRINYEVLADFYEEKRGVCIGGRTDQHYIWLFPPSATDSRFPGGKVIWATSTRQVSSPAWRACHLEQVARVMRDTNAPLALAALGEDLKRKNQRLVPAPDGVGSIQTFTARVPGEGLAGLFWRNLYGPPFTRLFGERLLSLPPGTHQDLGGGLVLVQPYELPSQAMTPEGDAAEARLITVLGPECFYDFQHHQKPTRLPELSTASA
jgi:hypothetical protein